jgi:hypothetical protein
MLFFSKYCRGMGRLAFSVLLFSTLSACQIGNRDPQYGAYPYHSELRDYYLGDKATVDPELERELNYGWDIGP